MQKLGSASDGSDNIREGRCSAEDGWADESGALSNPKNLHKLTRGTTHTAPSSSLV